MNHLPRPIHIALMALLAAACGSLAGLAPTTFPGTGQAVTKPASENPTGPGAAGLSPATTPAAPAAISSSSATPSSTLTAAYAPSSTPTASPTAASTPLVPVAYRSIQMMDRKIGWAMADVGLKDEAHVLRTADGGATWHDVSPLDVDFYGVYFLDAQTAWAWSWDSGPAWRTLDGGQSWTPVGDFGAQPDIGFVDSQHGWNLVGESWGLSFVQFDIVSFSTTQDGGQTWQETNPPPSYGSAYMAYPDAQTAWAVRAGFAKTIEGVPNLGVPFHIDTTFDGGRTWTTRPMPLPPGSLRSERPYEGTYLGGVGNCEFVSPVYSTTAVWKLALTCEDKSWMYTSANQGKTWIISDMPAGLDADIDFIDASTGWLLIGDPYESTEGHLYQTTDGGQSWTLIKRTGWTDARLSFVDAQTGWAVACSDAYCYQREAQQALIKTTDGGLTWQVLQPQVTP